jgi:hypothetical protein
MHSTNDFSNENPEKRLMQAVLIQVMKDYACRTTLVDLETATYSERQKIQEQIKNRQEAYNWVMEQNYLFDLVAQSMEMDVEALREMCIKKMKDIDEGKPFYLTGKKSEKEITYK